MARSLTSAWSRTEDCSCTRWMGASGSGEGGEAVVLDAEESVHPEGPADIAVAWSDAAEQRLRLDAVEGPARLLRVEFDRGPN